MRPQYSTLGAQLHKMGKVYSQLLLKPVVKMILQKLLTLLF